MSVWVVVGGGMQLFRCTSRGHNYVQNYSHWPGRGLLSFPALTDRRGTGFPRRGVRLLMAGTGVDAISLDNDSWRIHTRR